MRIIVLLESNKNQRIVSKLGGGFLMDTVPLFHMMYGFNVLNQQEYNTKKHEDDAMVKRDLMGCGQPGTLQITVGLYNFLSNQPTRNDPEENIFYYHGDHLGSTSYITDVSGMPSQHIDYLPFGEPLLEEKTQTWQSPYKFNCKEQDEESGLNYYGARYLDSKWGMWLGVDPMSDKYPHQSNYAYCSNNPVKLIDPNGNDEWELNQKGEVIKHTITEKHDAFFIVDKNGNRMKDGDGKDISKSFKYGTVQEHNQPTVNTKGGPKQLDIFRIKGDKNAKDMFEFMANNTDVEWTHAKIGSNNSGDNMVGTSHDEASTSIGTYLRNTGYSLKEVNHNHPSQYDVPSAGDLKNRENYLAKNPQVRLNIYTKSGYRSYTTLDDVLRFNVKDYVR